VNAQKTRTNITLASFLPFGIQDSPPGYIDAQSLQGSIMGGDTAIEVCSGALFLMIVLQTFIAMHMSTDLDG
jgi:hypothetical protein